MNVAPVAPTPTPARAADAPSPAASAFGGLLAMASGTSGGTATPAAQPSGAPTPAPVEPAPAQPVATAAPAADHRPPASTPLSGEPEAQPDQPLADATAPEAETPAEPAPTASPAPATPAPTPAAVADMLVTQARPRQVVPTENTEIRKPVTGGEDDDADAKDGKSVGVEKDKTDKSAPTASGDAQPPQPVTLAAIPAPTAPPQPAVAHASGQKGEEADATGSSAGTQAILPTPHDPAGTAPAANSPDNLPPLLATQTPAMTPSVRQTPVFAPSLASQGGPVVTAEPGRIGRDIGVEIARHVAAGRDEVTIRLTPAEMGQVEVRLSFDSKGALHAAVRADNPQALDMLRRDAGDLGRSLADAGIHTDSSSFSFDRRDSSAGQFAQQQQQQQQQQHGHSDGRPRHAGAAFRDDSDSTASPSPYRQLRTSSRVDLMA